MTDIIDTRSPDASAFVLQGNDQNNCSPVSKRQTHPACGLVLLKQIKQSLLMKGIERVLSDIYGESFDQPVTLISVLNMLNVDSQVIEALTLTDCHPVANKLVERLTNRLTLTAEGQKQFEVLNMLYGISGEPPRSVAEVSALYGVSPKDIKHLSIMMRCRLESEQIKSFVEETLRMLIKDFTQSLLFAQLQKVPAVNHCDDVCSDTTVSRAIGDLEKEARRILAGLETSPTVNICGKAGTGKTSLALKVTEGLLQQGKKVLFVVHSRFFAQYIQSRTRFYPGDLTVSTFHALCHHSAKDAGIEIPSYRNNKVFNELFPELLIAAVHANKQITFDAIVVEEGHSLLPNFWRALKFCLKDMQKGPFLYFYDPVILNLAKNKAAPFASDNVTLESAIRANFNLADRGGLSLFEAISREEVAQAISKTVESLLVQNFRPDEIAILLADSLPKISDSRYNLPRGLKLAATPGIRQRHILHTSLASFRALTKPAVILILDKGLEDLADWKLKHLSYLAFSRADQKLTIIGNVKSIQKILPEHLTIVNPELFEPQLRRQ